MTEEYVLHLAYQMFFTALLLAAPVLVAGLIVGVAVGMLQAVTQVHEMTLTFVPKILAAVVALIVFMPWMLRTLIGFTLRLYSQLPALCR
ncbi:MAG: flagellar biosynthesis protein FliQ [Candidatus Oleimicrobiaceae bacterium]